jgi:hypothetical protein
MSDTTALPAFRIRDLSVLSYASGFTLWHYRAADAALAVLLAPDFFADGCDMFADGDMMHVSCRDEGATLTVRKIGDRVSVRLNCRTLPIEADVAQAEASFFADALATTHIPAAGGIV